MGLPFAPSPSQITVGVGPAAAGRRLFSSVPPFSPLVLSLAMVAAPSVAVGISSPCVAATMLYCADLAGDEAVEVLVPLISSVDQPSSTPFISSSNGRPSAAFSVRAHGKTGAVSNSGWATNEGPREPACHASPPSNEFFVVFYAGVVARICDLCLLLHGGATAASRAWLATYARVVVRPTCSGIIFETLLTLRRKMWPDT
ncbi:hypothetical protein PIB30_012018 [Stylosanthes scabra]|uniref:Secreted protein n=1 Tax=Stylosanthes scabra TaxID=79078 RepID=A0ABU6Y7R6_9FABA|nr:hypothetical protein [Stylosanthes scabra]